MKKKELQEQINKLEARIEKLENPVKTYKYLMPKPYSPYENVYPEYSSPYQTPDRCTVCNMEFSRVMGYVCGRSDCPTGITCHISDK